MAVKVERIVEEDLNLGVGTVDVTMPAGGTAVGHKIGQHSFMAEAVIATLTENQTLAFNTEEILEVNEEEYDPLGWFDPVTHIFTAQVAGVYRIDGYAYIEHMTGVFFLSAYKNDVYQFYEDSGVQAGQDPAITISGLVTLDVGDELTLRVMHTDETSDRTVSEGRISVQLVGRLPIE